MGQMGDGFNTTFSNLTLLVCSLASDLTLPISFSIKWGY